MLTLLLYDKVVPQNYSAESQLLVSPKKSEQSFANPFDLKYIETYSQLIYGENILNKVKTQYSGHTNYTVNELKSHMAVMLSKTSQVITIQVVTPNKSDSIELANLIGTQAFKTIPKVLDTNKLTLISKANKSEKLIGLTKKSYVLMASTLLFIFYYLIIIMYFIFGKRIYFNEQMEDLLGTKNVYKLKR